MQGFPGDEDEGKKPTGTIAKLFGNIEMKCGCPQSVLWRREFARFRICNPQQGERSEAIAVLN
jgi:hypothetical protein